LPQDPHYRLGIILRCTALRSGRDDQGDLAARNGLLSPLSQRVQRGGTHFLMDFRQFAQHDDSSITKKFRQLLQCRGQTLRRFKYDEREAGHRGTGKQSQTLSSLSGQEAKR
jgi:hypothetical protein